LTAEVRSRIYRWLPCPLSHRSHGIASAGARADFAPLDYVVVSSLLSAAPSSSSTSPQGKVHRTGKTADD
jgi:hypothetical protein